jgi:hypothetical protein
MASDDTAYAANWRTVIVIDLLLGLVVLVAGGVLMVIGHRLLGPVLGILGAAYSARVVGRGRRWRRMRKAAGL